jgi:hypothetical protein
VLAPARSTGFIPTKREVKLMLTGAVAQKQIDDVIKILCDLEADVKRRGVVGGDGDERE